MESELATVIPLQQLCMLTVRDCMLSKSTESLEGLGLPCKLLDLVSMRTLTNDLYMM